jgi:hypothetical protein
MSKFRKSGFTVLVPTVQDISYAMNVIMCVCVCVCVCVCGEEIWQEAFSVLAVSFHFLLLDVNRTIKKRKKSAIYSIVIYRQRTEKNEGGEQYKPITISSIISGPAMLLRIVWYKFFSPYSTKGKSFEENTGWRSLRVFCFIKCIAFQWQWWRRTRGVPIEARSLRFVQTTC